MSGMLSMEKAEDEPWTIKIMRPPDLVIPLALLIVVVVVVVVARYIIIVAQTTTISHDDDDDAHPSHTFEKRIHLSTAYQHILLDEPLFHLYIS